MIEHDWDQTSRVSQETDFTDETRVEERLYWRLWRRANAVSQISNFGAEIRCREFLNGWVAATQCGATRVGLWSWIIHAKSGKSRTVELVSEIFNYPFRAVHTITLTSFICNVPRGIVAQNLRDKKRWIWSIGHSFYLTLALLSLNISSSPRMPMPNPVMTTRAILRHTDYSLAVVRLNRAKHGCCNCKYAAKSRYISKRCKIEPLLLFNVNRKQWRI